MVKTLTKRQQTHQKILRAASRGFRRDGFSGIGVDGIAKAAGVTSGAFYAHFGSKEGAFKAALNVGLDEVIEAIPVFQSENGSDWVQAFADYYLGQDHRDDLEGGCAMTALSPEVVRAKPEIRIIFEQKMQIIIDLITQGLSSSQGQDDRGQRAWALLGTLIGGLIASRAVSDPHQAREIATAIKQAAVNAAGETIELSSSSNGDCEP